MAAGAALTGQVWFALLNGTGAVVFFFTLSGFVLARAALQTGDTRIVAKGVVKRWPRLALPALVATVGSWALFRLDLTFYQEAAALTRSPWLEAFANGHAGPFPYSFSDAVLQGGFFTFFRGDASYNSSLWTMRWELAGSFAVYGVTLAILALRSPARRLASGPALMVLGVAALLLAFASEWYVPFMAGTGAALLLPPRCPPGKAWRLALALPALYLLGDYRPDGVFAVFAAVPFVYVNTVGSILLIAIAYDVHLSGGWLRGSRFLGDLSFPIYLVHVPVICSLGSFVLVRATELGFGHPTLAAIAATFLASVLAALPLIPLNRWWIATLDRWTARHLA